MPEQQGHTPGPWSFLSRQEPVGAPGDGGEWVCEVVADGQTVASIYEVDALGEADANLIAAAPDLLAAAEVARTWLALFVEADPEKTTGRIVAQLEAAIAIARGQEQAP